MAEALLPALPATDPEELELLVVSKVDEEERAVAALSSEMGEPRSSSLKSGLLLLSQLNALWKREDKESDPVSLMGFRAMSPECDISIRTRTPNRKVWIFPPFPFSCCNQRLPLQINSCKNNDNAPRTDEAYQ